MTGSEQELSRMLTRLVQDVQFYNDQCLCSTNSKALDGELASLWIGPAKATHARLLLILVSLGTECCCTSKAMRFMYSF